MSDHVVINVEGLESAALVEAVRGGENLACERRVVEEEYDGEEELPLIQIVECRICQEEDHVKNLEAPCSCSGSLKYAHRSCVQRWCDEKKDITCEICHQTYQPGYTAPVPSQPRPDDTTIDISGGWLISGTPVDLHDRRFVAMAAAERRLLETQYDEYASTNASGSAFCRFAALTLLALFLLRHALETTSSNSEDDEDVSTFFSIFMLRAFGFLLPCYIMACAISVLQRRREIEEEARLAASEVAFVLQSGQEQGLHFTIVPGPAATHPEPHQ